MKPRRKITPLGVSLVVICAFLAIGVATFAGPCVHSDGSKAACAEAGTLLLVIGVAAALTALARFFVSSKTASATLAAVVAILGLVAAIVPGNMLPLCMMAEMRCNAIMHPFGMVLGGLACIIAIIDLVIVTRSSRTGRSA